MTDSRPAAGGAAARVPARLIVPLLLGAILNPLNTTMISVALVPISTSLGVDTSSVMWLVAGLYLTSSISQPIMGTLIDNFGPKRVAVGALAIVVIASCIPLIWVSFPAVVASRVLLGVGVSAAYPAALALIRHESEKRSIATPTGVLAGLSFASLTTGTIGPVLAGVLIAQSSWLAVFAANIPIALAAGLLAIIWLPADAEWPRRSGPTGSVLGRLDWVGIVLFGAAVGVLLVFLLGLRTPSWWLLAVLVVLMAMLIVWERHAPRPFIDVRVLVSNGALSRTYLRMLLSYLGPYTVVYGMSQWLQSVVGMSSAESGLMQMPATIVAGIVSVGLARTRRVYVPLLVGAGAGIAGGLIVAASGQGTQLWVLGAAIALFGLTQGLCTVANQVVVYRAAPIGEVGTAAGLGRTSVSISAIGASGMIGVVFGSAPSDGGLNTIGWIIVGAGVLTLALTAFDRSLRGSAG